MNQIIKIINNMFRAKVSAQLLIDLGVEPTEQQIDNVINAMSNVEVINMLLEMEENFLEGLGLITASS